MRNRTLALIFASLICLAGHASLPSSAQVLARQAANPNGPVSFLGFEFPSKFLGIPRVNVLNYEKDSPGLGFSASYENGPFKATVYIYDLQQTSIPEDVSAPIHLRNFRAAKQDVVAAQHQGLFRIVESKYDFTVSDPRNQARLNCAAMRLQRPERPGPSSDYVCTGAFDNKFFKLRITCHEDVTISLGNNHSEDFTTIYIKLWTFRLWPPSAQSGATLREATAN